MSQIIPFSAKLSLDAYLPRVDALWFDCDATLIDNEGQALDEIADIISARIVQLSNGEHPGVKECFRHLAGRKLEDIVQYAQEATDFEFDQATRTMLVEEIKAVRKTSWTTLTKATQIKPIVAIAEKAKAEHVPICIVTASEFDRAEHFIKVAGLNSIFTGNSKDWLFASNLKDKGIAHRVARKRLGEIHSINIDPRRWVGFEDSPGATGMGVRAGAVVIPHDLCTHIAPRHKAERHAALRQAKVAALREHPENFEFVLAADGVLKPLQSVEDVRIIEKPHEVVPVLTHYLAALPERTRSVSRHTHKLNRA